MAVLVEGISIVIRRDAINNRLVGGWDRFLELVPNRTLCADEDLARVGFLTPDDVGNFLDALEQGGLVFLTAEGAVDISVVDQQSGPTVTTPWLQYAHLKLSGGERTVATCWLFEGERKGHGLHVSSLEFALATPDGWRYEESLSASFEFRPTSQRQH